MHLVKKRHMVKICKFQNMVLTFYKINKASLKINYTKLPQNILMKTKLTYYLI